jgi:hypothetical protein
VIEVFRCLFEFAVGFGKKVFGFFAVAAEFAVMSLLRRINFLVGFMNVALCFLKDLGICR